MHLTNGAGRPGEIHRVLITHAGDYDLVGDLSRGVADPAAADVLAFLVKELGVQR